MHNEPRVSLTPPAMTVAVAGAGAGATKTSPPPVPALERPDWVAAKALTYLCLASMWVGGAGVAAASFIDLVWAAGASGVGYPVFSALLKLSTNAVLIGALLVLVVLLLLLRAALRLVVALVTDLRVDMRGMGISNSEVPAGESMGSIMLRDTAVIGWLASLPFVLLSVVGCVVMIVLSPAKGSLMGMICTVVIDVGVIGSMVLSAFLLCHHTKYGAQAVEDVAWRGMPCA